METSWQYKSHLPYYGRPTFLKILFDLVEIQGLAAT